MPLTIVLFLLFQTAEERAVSYLAGEVPKWSRDNGCFSCHNNGDGARALLAAHELSYKLPAEALSDSVAWLTAPENWDKNTGAAGFTDEKLSRIQFTSALVDAVAAGFGKKDSLMAAAESLLPHQESDGSWQVRIDAGIGTPVTYGPALATAMARKILGTVDEARFNEPIRRADVWLLAAQRKPIMDSAGIIIGLTGSALPGASDRIKELIGVIIGTQASDGGWGPYPNLPAEAFDTAIVLLALAPFRDQPGLEERIQRGRAFLESIQYTTGGWPETTRPAGGVSYAQHTSTSAWATLALLKTRR